MGNHNPSNDRSQDTKQAQKKGMPDQNQYRPGQQEQQGGQRNQDRNKDRDGEGREQPGPSLPQLTRRTRFFWKRGAGVFAKLCPSVCSSSG